MLLLFLLLIVGLPLLGIVGGLNEGRLKYRAAQDLHKLAHPDDASEAPPPFDPGG